MNIITRRRQVADCDHQTTIRTENAGLSRNVCRTCGRVSLGFVATHIDESDSDARESGLSKAPQPSAEPEG